MAIEGSGNTEKGARVVTSLTTKLLAMFLPLVLISVVVLFALLEYLHYQNRRAVLAETLDKMATIESAAFVKPLWEFDHDAVRSLLDNMARNPDFHAARVLDADGQLVARKGIEGAHGHVNLIVGSHDIVYETKQQREVIGKLEVTFHTKGIFAELKERLVFDALVVLVLVVVLVVVTFIVTRRVIGRPITELRASIERLRTENIREPVPWTSADEIGELVRTFNALQQTQAESEAEIKRYQEHLEQLVGERTRELKASEARFRGVLDHSPMDIHLKDSDGKYQLVNKAFLEREGLTLEEVVGKTSFDILPQETAERISNADQKVLVSGEVHLEELDIETRDGARQTVIMSKFPVAGSDGAYSAVGTVSTDITERKQAETALAEAHNLVTESLFYASRIQRALLLPPSLLEELMADHLMIWEPRDIVGGDMIWVRMLARGYLVVVADCTGHGVPGAFMTMIATGALDRALIELHSPDPAAILAHMNQGVKTALGQEGTEGDSDDGLELGICMVEPERERLTFAGARFSLFQVDQQEVDEIKGDRSGIGYRRVPMDQAFTNQTIPFESTDGFYMWSDGITDQVGGDKRRMYGKRRLKKILLDYHRMDMTRQGVQIHRELRDYQHNELRRDDLTIFGFQPRRTLSPFR